MRILFDFCMNINGSVRLQFKLVLLYMSHLLETVKSEVVKSRNLALYGKYDQAITNFNSVIDKIAANISCLNDKTLINQWNKLLERIVGQKDLAVGMKDVLLGNFDKKEKAVERRKSKEESSQKQFKHNDSLEEELVSEVNNCSFKKAKKKAFVHEDDEIYNRKEKEMREKERADRAEAEREKEQRQREFDEREAEIWPKKKPVPRRSNKPANNPTVSNNSGVGKTREYTKPWLVNAKNPNNPVKQSEENKSFLKHCYPDGNGPDSNLIEMLEKEVVVFNPNITFEDIAELQKAKDVLEEAVLLPLLMPHLFTGIRRAWKGVLLFGPPGTGKTLLAKAIASGGKTTFFNVTSSSLASKWRGQSEKLVRLLFQMAAFYAPSTIFIDEIDALASKRGERQDDANRKVKTELMTRIDGVSSGEEGKSIVVIGATNRPQDLDEAIRRRLQKRIYIPLPTEIGRREMLRINLKDLPVSEDVNIEQIVTKTDGYSGADIALLCREASYMPMRRKLKEVGGLGKKMKDVEFVKEFQKEVNIPLTMEDFEVALKNVKPSVGKNDLGEYEKWMKEFGEQGTD